MRKTKQRYMKTKKVLHTFRFSSSRKGQMKMMENMGIMFVFFILIGLGFVFYARIGGHSAVQAQEKVFQQRAVKLAQIISSLPEVRCSEENVAVQDCFDLLRMEATRDMWVTDSTEQDEKTRVSDNLRYYMDVMSFSTVTINEIFPGDRKIVLYDRQPIKIDSGCDNFEDQDLCYNQGCYWQSGQCLECSNIFDKDECKAQACDWSSSNKCVRSDWESLTPIQIPITLFDATTDEYGFGILEVGIYEK